MVDDDHTIADFLHLGQNVRRQDHGVLFAQLFHQGTDLDDLFRVETNGRFVQDQNRRIVDERLCQTHTLPVTFRQVLDDSAGNVADPAEIADVLQMRAPWQLALFKS